MKRPPELRDTRPQRDSPAYGGEAPAAAGDSGAAGMMAGAAGDSGAAGAPRGSRGSALHRGLGAALALRRRARRGQRELSPDAQLVFSPPCRASSHQKRILPSSLEHVARKYPWKTNGKQKSCAAAVQSLFGLALAEVEVPRERLPIATRHF